MELAVVGRWNYRGLMVELGNSVCLSNKGTVQSDLINILTKIGRLVKYQYCTRIIPLLSSGIPEISVGWHNT